MHVNTFGTGRISDEVLEKYILQNFDMRPKAIIDQLDFYDMAERSVKIVMGQKEGRKFINRSCRSD